VLYKPAMLDDVIGRGASQRVFTLRILTTFAGVAIALAALGLFGVLSYGVKLRAREFGIRMALGADRGAIRLMVLRRGVAVAWVGIATGLFGSIALARVISSALFRVRPLDPIVLAGAIVSMSLVAAIAAFVPAYRATSTEPTTVLH
jgi:ABC-type antimicrobial peptide transport system permease subunit